jgi:endo-1,4-beta-D-glucanase Y/4-amino-4-deoxy-L-arabinose transferase-like glycosyltransferase
MSNSTISRLHGRYQPAPRVALLARARGWAEALGGDLPMVLVLVAVALLAHGLNMFHYPAFSFKDDEGIYMAQAWALLREGRLAPYTYFYDHAPGGWMLLAAWMGLTGGPHTFGSAIDSGRVLMLLLHLAMTPLLYHVARKLGCGILAAALVTLLFSLSPLAIFYQRLVLLDTIMMFWILLSLDLLLDGWGRLSRVILSGVCFGLALLTKETAIVLLPALLFIAVQQRWEHQGRFAIGGWVLPMLMVVSWYPLYAALKGELLPAGLELLPAGQTGNFVAFRAAGSKVSLLDAVLWQAARGGGGLLNLNNQFWQLVRTEWLPRDAVLFAGGAIATLANLIRGIRNRRALVAGLLGALPLFYLGRGGVVFDFYILLAIPFLCLNLGVLLAMLFARVSARVADILAVALVVALAGGYYASGALLPLYQERPDQAAYDAIAWVKQNVAADSKLIIRDDMWVDLHEPGMGGPAFPNAHSHWKVAADPAVRDGIFGGDWRSVDYLITIPELEKDFAATRNTVAIEALRNAHLIKRWTSAPAAGNLHPPQTVELWKVDHAGPTEAKLLADSAAYLSGRFEQDGAFVDANGTVTSEAQSYALLRAVWMGDRPAFDRAWAWTQAQQMSADGGLHWLWQDGKVVDSHTATDADTDTALALLMASKRWNDPDLREAGRRMVQAIWQRTVVMVNEEPYLTAGDWATSAPVAALNPSYFSPYAYRIFGEVDPDHDWHKIVDTGYRVLFNASAASLGHSRTAGLPPDWIGLDRSTGTLVPLQLPKGDTTSYSYDAARTYWRVALDLRWYGDGRANAYLRQAGFLRDEVARKGAVGSVYGHDGTLVENTPSLVGSAGALAALLTLDPTAANVLYTNQIVKNPTRDAAGVYWGDPTDLYGQEWAWFATALYANAVPDLWHAQAPASA